MYFVAEGTTKQKSHCDQYFRFAVIKQFKIKLAFVSRDKKSGFMRVDQ